MSNDSVKRPVRFFNTTGPCNPWDHYMLPPEDRLIGAQLHRYIGDKLYWVLHAPRQTGKTTFLQHWMRKINSCAEAVSCYVSLERCQKLPERAKAMPAVCNAIIQHAVRTDFQPPELTINDPSSMVSNILTNWAKQIVPKPLVLLFDEVDVLEGDTLISFLRQLRDGFANRGIGKFPVSIALVGMCDLKDYITKAKDGIAPNPGSPFNIKEDSVLLGNFTREEIALLFQQRTEETGQHITDEALEYIWKESSGQPWIVNSLFKRATMRILNYDDYSAVTLEHIEKAREQMILARETHLDSLAVRLREPAIRKIMETMLTGDFDPEIVQSEAFRLCMDLGLVSLGKGTPSIANPIYKEVLARQITFGIQTMIPEPEWQWEKADGSLDMDALLKEFQKFWRRNSEIWEQKSDYTEAFPHLLLMAFLQRVLNGGGHIDREYAAGRGRMDLAVEYNSSISIIEIKLIHSYNSPEEVRTEGLEQITKYRDKIDMTAPAYLIIFDRRLKTKEKSWDERLTWNTENSITVIGC